MGGLNINDYVVSGRVRLARNIEGIPFPHKQGIKHTADIAEAVSGALKGQGTFEVFAMDQISAVDANCLVEKHLISPALKNRKAGAAILREDEAVSVMINEEDHIRVQCLKRGWDLAGAYKTADEADDAISARLPYAFDERLGYLTACPTNLGTGMRASAMMFLPGLTMQGAIPGLMQAVSRLNMTVRGVYGEGSKAEGYLYQVSNQRSLGLSEQEILQSVENTVQRIADAEMQERESLLKAKEVGLKDTVLRALGTLLYSYSMDSREFMELISLVKLGGYYGFINITDKNRLEKLIIEAQPGGLISISGKSLGLDERDLFRSEYVGKELAKIVKA